MGRIGCRAGLALAALTVAAVLLPSAPAGAAELCAPSAPAGHVRIAVIVDYGTEPGAPGSASVRCLTVPDGTTGGQLLKQRAELLGTALPSYATSGLLCTLDGFPRNDECGAASGDEFRYWSYWSGTSGSWVYGQGNPFTRRLRDGDIEGWRFVSAAESAAPPPRVAPSTDLFPAPPAPTPAPAPALPSVDTPGAAPVVPGPERGATTTLAPVPSAEGAGATSTTSTLSTSSTDRAAVASSADTDEPPPIGEIAIEPTADSSGPPVATVAGALLVAGMVVAGGLRLRRSS